jgi:hypothetical protein
MREGPVVTENERALRGGAVTATALALVFWSRSTGNVVILLAVVMLFVLAVIELLGRPSQAFAEVWMTQP